MIDDEDSSSALDGLDGKIDAEVVIDHDFAAVADDDDDVDDGTDSDDDNDDDSDDSDGIMG